MNKNIIETDTPDDVDDLRTQNKRLKNLLRGLVLNIKAEGGQELLERLWP